MGGAYTRQTYNIDEVARILGIGRNQAYEAVRAGQIPSIRIGKRLLVPRTALDRLLDRANTAASPNPPVEAARP
jgi:excisionase family DNA binding protein